MVPKLTRVILVVLILGVFGMGVSGGAEQTTWKGAQTMAPGGLAPSPDRCGEPPTNVQLNLLGNGIDTVGGTFVVVASLCIDLDAMDVFDLEATDIYTSGESISIVPGDFSLELDAETCVATNAQPVPFSVGAGTGSFAGAEGGGTYHFALNWPPCNGLAQPAHIWFDGTLEV